MVLQLFQPAATLALHSVLLHLDIQQDSWLVEQPEAHMLSSLLAACSCVHETQTSAQVMLTVIAPEEATPSPRP